MKFIDFYSYKFAKPNFSKFIVCMILIYAFNYQPFLSETYIPTTFRISLELTMLFLLFLINIRYSYFVNWTWLFPCIFIFGASIFFGTTTARHAISLLNKIIFLILASGLLCGNRNLLKSLNKILIFIAYFFSITAILCFLGYVTGFIPFNDFYLGGIDSLSYYYLHNSLLGNLTPRNIFGFDLARTSGYMFEAGLLGITFALNILLARYWFNDLKKRSIFLWLNFIAGITTFSTTFFFFLALYFLFKATSKFNLDTKSHLFLFGLTSILFILLITMSGYINETSAFIRLERIIKLLSFYEASPPLNFFLGNDINLVHDTLEIGIDSGWFSLMIQRGFLLFIFYACTIIFFTKNYRELMFYFLIVNFVFNTLASPYFLLFIAVSYANHKHNLREFA
jgi:hypothetical protein